MAEIVNLVRVQAKAEGFEGVASSIERLRSGYMSFGAALGDAAPKVVNLTNAFQRFERGLDPMGAKLAAWAEKSSNAVNYAFDKGLITAERAAQRMEIIQKRLSDLGSVADRDARRVAEAEAAADRRASNRRIEARELTIEKRAEARAKAQSAAIQEVIRQQEELAEEQQRKADEYQRRLNARFGIGQTSAIDPKQQSSLGARLAQQAAEVEEQERRAEALAATRAGSLAERTQKETAAIDAAMARRNAQIAARDKEADDLQTLQFEREDRRERRLAQIDRSPSRAQDAREARGDARRAAAERELGSYLNERYQQADPLGAAYARHAEAVERINTARREGLRTEQQLASILAYENKVLRDVERDFGSGKGGFRASQRTNLGYQGYDILSGITSGQPLGLIAAQQLPQVSQILGDHEGGIRGGLKALKDDLLGLVTPARLAFGGIVALAGAAAYSVYRLEAAQQQLKLSLTGRGYGSGLTLQGVNDLAERNARSGNLTYGDSRQIAGIIAQSGLRSPGLMDRVMQSTRDYAITTGQDAVEGSKEWAQAIADPVRGLEMLEDRLGRVDAGTATYIRTQAAAGNRLAASTALFDAFSKRLADHRQVLSGLPLLWDNAKKGLDALIESLNKGVRPPEVSATDAADPRRMGQIGARRAMDATIEAMARADAERRKREDEAASRSRDIQDISETIDPDIRKVRELGATYDKLFASRDDADVIKNLEKAGISADKYREIIEKAERAKSTFITSDQRQAEQHAITTQAILANNVAQEAAAAAAQRLLDLKGKEVTESERLAEALRAEQQVRTRAAKAAEDSLRATQYQARSAGMLSYPKAITDLRAQFEEELRKNQGADPATIARIRQDFAIRAQTLNTEQVQGPLNQTTLAINAQITSLKAQRDGFLLGTEAAAEMAAKQELINQYLQAGITPSGEMLKSIDALAKKMGEFAAANENFQRDKANVIGGMDELRQGVSGLFSGITSDLVSGNGKNIGQTIIRSLTRMNDQLLERLVFKPLTEGLLGRFGKPGGGLIGDPLSKIFGDPKQAPVPSLAPTMTPMMTVQAGTVVINGAGIGAGIGGGALGTNPITGQPLGGTTGSGILGFGLGGPQASGARGASAFSPVGSGIGAFGLGPNGVSLGSGSLAGVDLTGITKLNSPIQREVAAYVASAAAQRGIDPNTALRVVQQESSFLPTARNLNGEASYGPMQLNLNGGLGAVAQRAGVPVTDPSAWRQQVDFGLDTVTRDGWRQWMGARDVGISRWQGIGGAGGAPRSLFNPPSTSEQRSDAGTVDFDAASKSFAQSTETASKSVADLSQSVGNLPDAASSATNSLSSFASSLLNFKPETGGGGINLGGLFGGGGGFGVGETAMMAGGGYLRGPGTGTSDSIPAWLSNGEYVVNAAATSRHRGMLDHINFGAGYAGGGPVKPMAPVPVPMPPLHAMTPAANSNAAPSYTDARTVTYHIPPTANGVTPQDVVNAIEAYDRRLDRSLPGKMTNANRRYG